MVSTIRNHVTLVGNIGTEAQITNFQNGSKLARFNVATNHVYRSNSGTQKQATEWHRILAKGNLASFIERYGEIGKKVAIHGKLVNRTYFNKNGVKRNVTEVEVHHILGL